MRWNWNEWLCNLFMFFLCAVCIILIIEVSYIILFTSACISLKIIIGIIAFLVCVLVYWLVLK